MKTFWIILFLLFAIPLYGQYQKEVSEKEWREYDPWSIPPSLKRDGKIKTWVFRGKLMIKEDTFAQYYIVDRLLFEKDGIKKKIRTIDGDLIPWVRDCKWTLIFMEDFRYSREWKRKFENNHIKVIERIVRFYNLPENKKEALTVY